MKLLLIFTPHAAAGRAARLFEPLSSCLEKFAGIDVCSTSGPGDATKQVAETELAGYDGVLAAGGDGTLFEVLNGLYARPPGDRPPLGVIPVGTGNAFARDLGLSPGDWKKGVDLVAGRRTRRFDVGRVVSPQGSYHYLNIVGAGLPVDVMRSSLHLKALGRASYSVTSLLKALQMRCYPLKITADGKVIEGEFLFIEVSNTRYTGTSFLIAPAAEPDDGLLDLVLVGRLPRLRVLRLFPSVFKGRHVDFDEVETLQAREVRIESERELMLAPDGELRGVTPVTITCLHRDLDVFAP